MARVRILSNSGCSHRCCNSCRRWIAMTSDNKTPAQRLFLRFLATRERPGYLQQLSEIQAAVRAASPSDRPETRRAQKAALKQISIHISALINNASATVMRDTRDSVRIAMAHWVNREGEDLNRSSADDHVHRRAQNRPRYIGSGSRES